MCVKHTYLLKYMQVQLILYTPEYLLTQKYEL